MAKVLGKGLGALIKTYNSEEDSKYLLGQIAINKIQPNSHQPRKIFNKEDMEELKLSIKKHGILQPITVHEYNNGIYEIIAGERRYRAAKSIGLKWVPAYTVKINTDSEMMEYALIENIQRVNLNAIEEAEGYAILSGKYNLTQNQIALKVSKSRTEIANKLRLLKLPPIIKDSVRNNQLSYGHARSLASLRESKVILTAFYNIVKKQLNVRETESLIQSLVKNKQSKTKKVVTPYEQYELKLQKYLQSKTSIYIKKNNKGNIKIDFSSIKKLKKIIKLILQNEQ